MQSADRALRILASFDSERTSLGVSEVAYELGIHKSTVSRLMATLQRRGFVRREGERFVPGPELARLAQPADTVALLVARAEPAMEWLAAATGEAVTLGVARDHGAGYVAQRDGAHILKVGDWVGRSTTLHSTATGKVLLAFSDLRDVGGSIGIGPRLSYRVALRRELERTRLRGYGLTRDELEIGSRPPRRRSSIRRAHASRRSPSRARPSGLRVRSRLWAVSA